MKRTVHTRRAAVTAAVASLSLLLSTVSAQSPNCNGHPELCSRSYSNISYVGAHNSYSVSPGSLAENQNYDVSTQLDNGIRLLQNQGHKTDAGPIHLCHSSCLLLDAGPVEDYLGKVKSWLDENQDEVVTILWVNQDNIPVSTWAESYTAVGLDTYAYVPTSTPVSYSSWPTLSELISSNKRLITFMDYGADYSSVPYILDHFTHFWENPYDQTDPTFPCTVDRGDESSKMFMINHYLDKNLTFFNTFVPVPDTSNLASTNAISGSSSLGDTAEKCASQHGQYPTFMLVDFYDVGNGSVFEVAAELNGVQYSAIPMGNGTILKNPTHSNSSTSTSGSGSEASSGGSTSAAMTRVAAFSTLGSAVTLVAAASLSVLL